MKTRFYKDDYTDLEWHNLLQVVKNLPTFVEMFDEQGEVKADYLEVWNSNSHDIEAEYINISEFSLLVKYLILILKTNKKIKSKLVLDVLIYVEPYLKENWEFKGSSDDLGFLLDVWDKDFEEVLECTMFWYDEY